MKTHPTRHAAALLFTVALAAALATAPARAKDVIKQTPAGGINWTRGVVFAKGYGTARADLSPAQRRILSRRAAIVDGQRNLLEITKGVRITSVLSTGQAMQKSIEVASRVQGIVKGAQPVSENYQNDIYSVTMEMPISGDFLKVLYPRQAQNRTAYDIVHPRRLYFALRPLVAAGDKVLDFLITPAEAAGTIVIRNQQQADAYRKLLGWLKQGSPGDIAPMLTHALHAYEANNQFSGLLIDAKGIANFQLATMPKIRDQTGKVLYPTDQTNYSDLVNNRGVTYDFDMQDAVRNKRVAKTPFIIKALSTYKNLASDLVISTQDAKRMEASASTVQAMNNAGVLIVVSM